MRVGVLRDVVIERRSPDIGEILQNQAVVGGADIGASGFPENGVGGDAIHHDWTSMIAQIRGGGEMGRECLSCCVAARERCGHGG